MNDINQCYEILGLKPGASPDEVKLAYRDLAMVWHPDRFAANNPRLKEKAQEELKKINAAYEVLKSHQVSCSANTNSSTADTKTSQASPSNPQPPSAADAKSYYVQGMEKAQRGKYKEAIEDFNYAIRIIPYYIAAYKYRGIAYSKLGDKQRAFYDFKQTAYLHLRSNNVNDYYDVIELIKKLQISETAITLKTNYRRLRALLSAGKWKEADLETLAVMLKIAGREKQGYLRAEDIKNFPFTHLHIIDQLWSVYSNGHFGFRVQKRVWQSLEGLNSSESTIWCDYCDRVGWRLKDAGTWGWIRYDKLVFSLNAPAGNLPAALPGKGYSLKLILLYLVFTLLAGLIFSFLLNSQVSSFLPGTIVSTIFFLQEMCSGNQRYTREWWKHLFSRLENCEL